MTLYRFIVHMHGHGPGDVVDVHPDDVVNVEPLVQAGLLEPVYPVRAAVPVPSRHKRSLTGSVTVTHADPVVETDSLDSDPVDES